MIDIKLSNTLLNEIKSLAHNEYIKLNMDKYDRDVYLARCYFKAITTILNKNNVHFNLIEEQEYDRESIFE